MPVKSKTVPVYGQNGEVEQHSYPNARDLVANCDGYWAWKPQAQSTPMDSPPFTRLVAPSNKPQTHEILERLGTGAVRDVEDVKPIETEDADETLEENDADIASSTASTPVAEESVTETQQAAPAAKVVTPRRKRFEG